MPGMTFKYTATLTWRSENIGEERTSQYELNLVINDVTDNGNSGMESTLSFTGSGNQTLNGNWEDTVDFDSWVARLGPALATDTVGAGEVVARLSATPQIPDPPSPPPKVLPQSGTFFMDVRNLDAIRSNFSQTYAGQNPQFVDAEMNAGRHRFGFSGRDDTIFFYPDRAKMREISIEYDPIGYLVRLDETIGDTSSPPSASCRIVLTEGP